MIILNKENYDIMKAASMLRAGEIVAFPTETVYGVSCVYNNLKAYEALNALKERTPDKPYTLMLSEVKEIKKYARVDDRFIQLLNKFLPGSVTFLLPAVNNLPTHVYKNGIVGIRIPSNKVALSLLKAVGIPLLVPSLNKANEAPLKEIKEIKKQFNNQIAAIIEGEIKENIPSTVVSLVNGITIIREGKVPSKIIIEEYNKL